MLRRIDCLNRLDVGVKQQIPRRIWRSTILKLTAVVTQQMNVMKGFQESSSQFIEFGGKSRSYLLELVDKLEREGFMLCDTIDSVIEGE